MEKINLKKLFGKSRIAYHFSILLLTFCLIITSSFAWFSTNRKTNVNDVGVSLEVDDTSAIYRAYVYDLKKGVGINTKDDGTEINVTNLDLNQYDTLFRARNKYTPAFAKINVTRHESMPASGTVHLTIERMTDGLEEGKEEYTSNIARFTAFIISDKADVGIIDANELYNFINTTERYKTVEAYSGNGRADSKTFITIRGDEENHTHEKATSITISVNYTEDDWYKNENGYNTLNLYLYITYDVQLIDCYFSETLGNEIDLNATGIVFGNDLKKITISYDK